MIRGQAIFAFRFDALPLTDHSKRLEKLLRGSASVSMTFSPLTTAERSILQKVLYNRGRPVD